MKKRIVSLVMLSLLSAVILFSALAETESYASTGNDESTESHPDTRSNFMPLTFNRGEVFATYEPGLCIDIASTHGYTFRGIRGRERLLLPEFEFDLSGGSMCYNNATGSLLFLNTATFYGDVAIGAGKMARGSLVRSITDSVESSNVHGVEVNAYIAECRFSDWVGLVAYFYLKDIPFNVSVVADCMSQGKEKITNIVNILILYAPEYGLVSRFGK